MPPPPFHAMLLLRHAFHATLTVDSLYAAALAAMLLLMHAAATLFSPAFDATTPPPYATLRAAVTMQRLPRHCCVLC